MFVQSFGLGFAVRRRSVRTWTMEMWASNGGAEQKKWEKMKAKLKQKKKGERQKERMNESWNRDRHCFGAVGVGSIEACSLLNLGRSIPYSGFCGPRAQYFKSVCLIGLFLFRHSTVGFRLNTSKGSILGNWHFSYPFKDSFYFGILHPFSNNTSFLNDPLSSIILLF